MMIGIDKKGVFGNEIKRVNLKGRIIFIVNIIF